MKANKKKCEKYIKCIKDFCLLVPLLLLLIPTLILPFYPDSNLFFLRPMDSFLPYLALPLLIFLYYCFLESRKKEVLSERRKVEPQEVKNLMFEFNRYSNLTLNEETVKKIDQQEYEKMKKSLENNDYINEQAIVPMRKILVDCYPFCELESQCDSDLRTLREYSAELDDYEKIEEKIKRYFIEIEKGNKNEAEKLEYEYKIRAKLKEIRELIAFFEENWAKGEVIVTNFLWISVALLLSGIFLGIIMPLMHPMGGKELGIVHWAILGTTGGILSVIIALYKEDRYADIGETAGKKIIKQTILSSIIGGITAVILFSFLKSNLIQGKIFPEINANTTTCNHITQQDGINWLITGPSIVWALLSGITIKIFNALSRATSGFAE